MGFMMQAVLIGLGVFDVWTKKLPVVLLLILSIGGIWEFAHLAWQLQLFSFFFAALIGACGIYFQKKKQLGGGDVWLLIVLVLFWPPEIFCKSIGSAAMLLGLAAVGIWLLDKESDGRVPFVPFILLGYWITVCGE